MKTVGLDNARNRPLEMAADVLWHRSQLKLFTHSINSGILPNDCKEPWVSPLFKNGVKNYPNNYRPISTIPAVIFDQIYAYLHDNNLLSLC